MKKILVLLLALSMAFCLFACGGGKNPCEHVDGDNNGVCDKCSENMETTPPAGEEIALIENGEANFQFVISATGTSLNVIKAVDNIIKELRALGVKVTRVTEKTDNIEEIEVLVGDVTTRGEDFVYDKYTLGNEGYVVKLVGKKIIINAVTENSLLLAISKFRESVLGITDDTDSLSNVTVSDAKNIVVIQDDYTVTALKAGGVDMTGYTLATDTSNKTYKAVAEYVQKEIYDNTGYRFEIVNTENATDKSIVIKHVAKDAVDGGFKISVSSNGQILIECGYDNALEATVEAFLDEKVLGVTGEVNLTGTVYTKDVSVVYYEDFGAVGDGVTDDFEAIYNAHVYANEGGQLVKATPDKTYLLVDSKFGKEAVTIPIKTDVVWTGANFIIDDTNLSVHTDAEIFEKYIFTVLPDEEATVIDTESILNSVISKGLNRDTEKIELGYDYPVIIITRNDSHKVYRRKGYNSYMGQPMQEIIVLDKDGNVTNPIIFDYNDLTSLEVYSLKDLTPLTIDGGVFTTKASRVNCVAEDGSVKQTYFNRGIDIRRSYTTMKNLEHYVEGEFTLDEQCRGMIGAAYHGFFSAHNSTDVLYENCVFTARRCYRKMFSGGTGGATGTYAHNAWDTNNLTYKNCTQSNFWITVDPDTLEITPVEEGTPGAIFSMTFMAFAKNHPNSSSIEDSDKPYQFYWGSGGTNFCKNVVFDHSTFSRFDAHSGMWGGKIINGSTFNTIALTGGGDMEISDSRWFAEYYKGGNNALIGLRSDYGATWEGNITAKNVKCYAFTEEDPYGDGSDPCNVNARDGDNSYHEWAGIQIISHSYVNWYYGYTCHFPSLELYNLDFYDIMTNEPIAAGTEIEILNTEQNMYTSAMHLPESHTNPYFSVEDRDEDGYVDYPYDHDGDGEIGNTTYLYADYFGKSGYEKGIKSITTLLNLNPVCPPKHIKVFENDGVDGAGGYSFVLENTAKNGIKSGGYHGIAENNGGFFGSTTFYYYDEATNTEKSFVGTATNYTDSPFTFE